MNIDSSLLREKFIINEKKAKQKANALSITCPSNRMPVNLQSGGLPTETYIARAHNMHSCTRMVAEIISDYEKNGPIMSRAIRIDWAELWEISLSEYENKHNPDRWIAIYSKGKLVFSEGYHHPFLDVIEKCDIVNKGSYEKSIELAVDAFARTGTRINMDYDSNIALIAILSKKDGRCSMVLRGLGKSTTFNYSIKPIEKSHKLNTPRILSAASDFLEGVQLSYMVGINNERLNYCIIEKYSGEHKKTIDAMKRIEDLDIKIDSMENSYEVRYRPERPDFNLIISSAEELERDNILNNEGED